MYPMLESQADVIKMLDEMTQTRATYLERCSQLSTSQLDDPVYPGSWSLHKNLAHLAWAEAYMLAWILKRPGTMTPEEFPPEPPLEMPRLRKAFDEAHAATIAFVKSQPEAVLKEACLYSKKGRQTVGGVLFHLIEHEIHHRGFIMHKLSKLAPVS